MQKQGGCGGFLNRRNRPSCLLKYYFPTAYGLCHRVSMDDLTPRSVPALTLPEIRYAPIARQVIGKAKPQQRVTFPVAKSTLKSGMSPVTG